MYKENLICVILPAFNEEQSIASVIQAIPEFVDFKIVVDDGSSDATVARAQEAGAKVVSHTKNMGLGIAFKTGIEAALRTGADVIVNIDSDGQFNPKDIVKLVEPIVTKKAGFATASRFKDPAFYPKMSRIKFYGNHIMSYLISSLLGERYYDVSCGFRAYSRDTACKLNLFGTYTYTQESFIDLSFKGITIAEVPIAVRGVREFGKSKVASNLFKYTYNCLKIIVRIFRDYRALRAFGMFSLIAMLIGLSFGTFFISYYLVTGNFNPHKWAAFVAAFFALFSMFLFIVGFVADMISRVRFTLEEILALLKNNYLTPRK